MSGAGSSTSTTNTKRTLKPTLGTVKKSMDIKSLTWFVRNAFHVGEGAWRERTRYFSTVDLATSIPTHDARRAPPGIGTGDLPDQLTNEMQWNPIASASNERVADNQLAVYDLAVLHAFRIERCAVGQQSRCDDQRIVRG